MWDALTSRVLPLSVPKSDPLPSITMKPYLRPAVRSPTGEERVARMPMCSGDGWHAQSAAVLGEKCCCRTPAEQRLMTEMNSRRRAGERPAAALPQAARQQGSRRALAVGLQQLVEGLRVELVVAQVERGVDGLERLEVYVELLLLAVVRQHRPGVDDQAVRRHLQRRAGEAFPSQCFGQPRSRPRLVRHACACRPPWGCTAAAHGFCHCCTPAVVSADRV